MYCRIIIRAAKATRNFIFNLSEFISCKRSNKTNTLQLNSSSHSVIMGVIDAGSSSLFKIRTDSIFPTKAESGLTQHAWHIACPVEKGFLVALIPLFSA